MISLALSAAMAGYAIILARCIGAWSHPAIVFSLFWGLVLFLARIGVWTAALPTPAAIYLLAAVAAFGSPVFLLNWSSRVETAQARSELGDAWDYTLLAAFLGLQLVALVSVPLNIKSNGFSLGSVFSDPLKFGADYIGARYTGQVKATIFSTVGTFANYAATPLCGLIIANRRSYLLSGLLLLPCFAPSLLAMFIFGDKGTLFLAISLFYGGLISGWLRGGETGLLTIRGAALSVLGAFVLVPVLFSAMIMKVVGKWNVTAETLLLAWRYFNSYAFGSLYAFGHWFEDYLDGGTGYKNPENHTWGFWTFLALGRRLAPNFKVPDGYYDEYFTTGGGITTNIYTMFRGMITDFGLVGSILVLAVLGAVASIAYRSALRHASPISSAVLIAMTGMTYSSYLLSIFSWASIYVAAGLVAVSLWAAEIFRHTNVAVPPTPARR